MAIWVRVSLTKLCRCVLAYGLLLVHECAQMAMDFTNMAATIYTHFSDPESLAVDQEKPSSNTLQRTKSWNTRKKHDYNTKFWLPLFVFQGVIHICALFIQIVTEEWSGGRNDFPHWTLLIFFCLLFPPLIFLFFGFTLVALRECDADIRHLMWMGAVATLGCFTSCT